MFRDISLSGFGAVLVFIALHAIIFRCGFRPTKTLCLQIVRVWDLLLGPKPNWIVGIRVLVFWVGLLSFMVLFLTGFVPLLLGGRLVGYGLMLHATLAPIFIICATVTVITGAGRYSFRRHDLEQMAELWQARKEKPRRCCVMDSPAALKVGFWVLAVLTLPVTLSMVLSMTPLFGTDGQLFLFHLHRYSSLAFSLAAIVMLYLLIRVETRRDIEI